MMVKLKDTEKEEIMDKREALELPLEEFKRRYVQEIISAVDVNYKENVGFIKWLYDNGYEIVKHEGRK